MKRDKTCKQLLLEYINANVGWHCKVDLYIIAREYSPETAGRALRSAQEEGLIQVEYYDSKYAKGLAKYASLGTVTPKPKVTIIIKESGERVAVMN